MVERNRGKGKKKVKKDKIKVSIYPIDGLDRKSKTWRRTGPIYSIVASNESSERWLCRENVESELEVCLSVDCGRYRRRRQSPKVVKNGKGVEPEDDVSEA